MPVDTAALPGDAQAAARPDVSWLAFDNVAAGHWSTSASRYDVSTRTVTAEISHLSWWLPWSWDWNALSGRGRSTGASPSRLEGKCRVNPSYEPGYWYVRATQCQDEITSVSADLSVHWPRLAGGANHSLGRDRRQAVAPRPTR